MLPVLLSHLEQRALIGALQQLPDDGTFVEYGSGGSTCMLAEHVRAQQTLISIEHTQLWSARVRRELDTMALPNRLNVVTLHRSIKDSTIQGYGSNTEENPVGCLDYLHPPINWSKVGVVFADGIARGIVLALTFYRCNPGTRVFVHDYTPQRAYWYEWGTVGYERVGIYDTLLELKISLDKS